MTPTLDGSWQDRKVLGWDWLIRALSNRWCAHWSGELADTRTDPRTRHIAAELPYVRIRRVSFDHAFAEVDELP